MLQDLSLFECQPLSLSSCVERGRPCEKKSFKHKSQKGQKANTKWMEGLKAKYEELGKVIWPSKHHLVFGLKMFFRPETKRLVRTRIEPSWPQLRRN